MTELEQRASVVAEARLWTGTPYHHRASVRGAGVDCALLILEAFAGAGIEERFDVGQYNHDWHLHRGEERYLEVIERYMARIEVDETPLKFRVPPLELKPADVIVFRVGRTFSHGAIVTKWPFIIHAYYPSRIVEEVDIRGTPMAERPVRVYSYWGTGQ